VSKLRKNKKISLVISISLFLLPCLIGAQVNAPDAVWVKENYSTVQKTTDATSSGSVEVDQTVASSSQERFTGAIRAEHQMLQFSSASNSSSFTRHLMCKDHDLYYNPIEPTTIFRPSDVKAECLTTISMKKDDSVDFRWYYRSNSSKTWIPCYNWSYSALYDGIHAVEGHLLIAGYWPSSNYPRAYKVDVYLDGSLAFSEFFEVTNGGLNSPRMCEDVDANGHPINMKSRFTIGVDTKAYHYLRFDKIAYYYFNEGLECCHDFTTVWIQPNGSIYKAYFGSFSDYKDTNVTWNYWNYLYISDDYISINSSTPIGNWKVEVYLDSYYLNNTWMRYGPIATTPFMVGSEPVADWTFMVYLDADSGLEIAGIDIFKKMASVGSSSRVNIVVQMDKNSSEESYDALYGNWTDCKRFNVTKGMIPTPGNATLHLGEVNMGDPETLKDFVNWTINTYPANYYFLSLWGHGTGCVGVCYDVTSAADALSLPELSQALSGLPVIMDVVLFDACSMSMIEVAYQIKDYVNVLVGTEGLGYAPPPYDSYLSILTSNPSMSPSVFASEVVTSYIEWCKSPPAASQIPNATMSATDLNKISTLIAAIDDFALKLKEKESFHNLSQSFQNYYLISLVRNLTEGYPGPLEGDTGYYIDLYHFAQLTYQHVLDEELRNISDQVMTTLESIIIMEDHKALPNSHGLSISFPDKKGKYEDNYRSVYEATTFAKDTLWDEFVKYHLSGYVLTIQTPYSNIIVKVDEESYTTDNEGKLQMFILPDSYTVNVTTPVLIGPGSRGVFTQWDDGRASNPRTLNINKELTLVALYKTQHYLTVNTDPNGLTPPKVYPQGLWYNESEPVTCTAEEISGYIFDHWTVDEISQGLGNNPITIPMNGPRNATAHYRLPPAWWENLFRPDILQVIVGLVGIVLTVALVVPAWVRTRRKRGVIKTFLNEIDDVYTRFKTDPRKCEEELYRLRNTILEGLTDGKISEESYDILDKRIDKYMEELQKRKKGAAGR